MYVCARVVYVYVCGKTQALLYIYYDIYTVARKRIVAYSIIALFCSRVYAVVVPVVAQLHDI